MRGTKANARAQTARGLRNDREYQAPFMRPEGRAEKQARQNGDRHPLGDPEKDPRGWHYMVATGGAALPCFVRPSISKKG